MAVVQEEVQDVAAQEVLTSRLLALPIPASIGCSPFPTRSLVSSARPVLPRAPTIRFEAPKRGACSNVRRHTLAASTYTPNMDDLDHISIFEIDTKRMRSVHVDVVPCDDVVKSV